MLNKIEIDCYGCNRIYAVVTPSDDDDVMYCPFCGVTMSSDGYDDDDEE